MILTPQELQEWLDDGKSFNVIDIRSEKHQIDFPLTGLNSIFAEASSIPKTEMETVMVCQFGIITEDIILEKRLDNTFSLLGGAQAWESFQTEKRDLSRWSRQTVLPEIGFEGQKKLANASVAISGMGGLGCPVAQSLAAAGIGKLKIIDGDKVALSNLHRQPLYGVEDVGRMKVEVAEEKLKLLNETVVINSCNEYLNNDNGMDLISDVDIIIDATDNIPSRQVIDRISKAASIPMIFGGVYRHEGHVAVLNINGSPGYKELFPESHSAGDPCADAGVLGMLPAIIGNIQALEAVKLIVGIEPNLAGKLLIYDGLTHRSETIIL